MTPASGNNASVSTGGGQQSLELSGSFQVKVMLELDLKLILYCHGRTPSEDSVNAHRSSRAPDTDL